MFQARGRVSAAFVLTCMLAAPHLQAQSQGAFEQWTDTAAPRAPKLDCRHLREMTTYEYSIDEASVVPRNDATPEHCVVQGQILPEVRFEVTLPRAWNGRLYMFGNGGFAGESLTARARIVRRDAALARGFAVVWTNTGHLAVREPLATFAASPQKLIDYAYRAVHVTALTAKQLVGAYYGSAPERSYFDGCSTGGRQGLISAQRFPADFDGIVVGAPVLDFSGTMLHYARFNLAVQAAPALARKVGVIAANVYEKCDAVDGVKDGLIADPRACRFDPVTDLPACPRSGSGGPCLNAAELRAVHAVYGDLNAGGAVRFPGLPVGSEIQVATPSGARSGWDPWIITGDRGPSISRQFMESFFRHMATPGRAMDWRTVDAEKDAPQLETISTLLNATDPDLSRFRERGGKIVMYFGWADPALNPLMGVRYYERVLEKMGPDTAGFFRLFMMPGMFHCGGGPGPDRADMITALAAWVEQGTAPDSIVASKREGEKVTRTRPLCPYPRVARYDGRGPIDDAASFSCGAPIP